ncbi:hypothetical protein [Aquisalinus flavus]|uniref:Uncharacterized protein n=1 Tax=Aquisalinus flavus TaxID=1526572 RepID=A0A8J2Y496_9PROT|nr:hypothetical protein [Aquisalinus flavus]MBD0425362.1 hypothetical protein [Aquisalinus flavus]UNE48988.1 hypothetical protein FF099_13490 [Aquisalinus flavus]GGD16691.1 hypothetical protein GCM10011342_26810 [Aquisalinus flavus]
MIEYRKRESILEKTERIYRLTGDEVQMVRPDGYVWGLKLAEIATIRVAYAPTRSKTNRYLATIIDRKKARLQYDNMHFAGIADFEDRSVTFSEFTRFLIDRVQSASPTARLMAGAPAASYVGQLAFVAVVFFGLALVIFSLPVSFGNLAITFFIKAGIIVVFLPFLFRWIVKGRPRQVAFDAIPQDYLPKPGIMARGDGSAVGD